MKRTVFKGRFTVLALLLLVASIIPVAFAIGVNPFRLLTTTENGLSTWNSDMIDIEAVSETGDGVYVAVLDTGLAPNWRDYFPEERILTRLGKGFVQPVSFEWIEDEPTPNIRGEVHESTFIGSSSSTHGTSVISTIIGYFYDSTDDSDAGYPLPPIVVRGIATNVNIIPVKVLADYTIPPNPEYEIPAHVVNFGTGDMVAAGIDYATDLAIEGYSPMIIIIDVVGRRMEAVEQIAIARAIVNGVIVVAPAGDEGVSGMTYPGGYPPVITVGAVGWTGEWLHPGDGPFNPLWWLQSDYYPYADIPESTPLTELYIPSWSSRQQPGQQIDVLAPGSWIRGPSLGYAHIPWWSGGAGDILGYNLGNFYFVGGTGMAAPHVTGVAALMLEKNPTLTQGQIEAILGSTSLFIPAGSATVFMPTPTGGEFVTVNWGYDATGRGLVQAKAAVDAVPPP